MSVKYWPKTELNCWPLLYIIIPAASLFPLTVKQIKVMECKKENRRKISEICRQLEWKEENLPSLLTTDEVGWVIKECIKDKRQVKNKTSQLMQSFIIKTRSVLIWSLQRIKVCSCATWQEEGGSRVGGRQKQGMRLYSFSVSSKTSRGQPPKSLKPKQLWH